MERLWEMFSGEPFMENPALGILSLNPRKRKRTGVKTMAVRRRKRTTRRRGRKSAAPRVRRAPRRTRRASRRRRNWAMPGVVVAANPHRRRSRRRRSNPVRKHHRRRRNPGLGGLFGGMPPIKSVVFAGIGFAGPSLVSGFLTSTFPTVMQSTTNLGVAGKYIVKIGSIIGLAWLAKRFVGQNEGNMVMIGGGANIALSLVNDFAPGFLPANPLGMYLPTVFPSMQSQAGMRAYVPLRGLNAATRPLQSAAAFPSSSAVSRGNAGAYGGTAARFKRF